VCGYRVGLDVARACLTMLPTLLLVMAAAGGMLRDPMALATLLLLCRIFMFALCAFLGAAEAGRIDQCEHGRGRSCRHCSAEASGGEIGQQRRRRPMPSS
jgi:uncharacterized membrane protein YeiH